MWIGDLVGQQVPVSIAAKVAKTTHAAFPGNEIYAENDLWSFFTRHIDASAVSKHTRLAGPLQLNMNRDVKLKDSYHCIQGLKQNLSAHQSITCNEQKRRKSSVQYVIDDAAASKQISRRRRWSSEIEGFGSSSRTLARGSCAWTAALSSATLSHSPSPAAPPPAQPWPRDPRHAERTGWPSAASPPRPPRSQRAASRSSRHGPARVRGSSRLSSMMR